MNKLILFLPFLLFISCKPNGNSIKSFQWMEGKWIKDEATPTESIEVWKTVSEKEMKGFGLTTENGDTIFYEKLSIIKDGSEIFYQADVGEGQIRFKLTNSEDNRWSFENPEHDFPQRIIYAKEGNDMVAYAEAGDASLEFRFKKLE